MLDRVPGLITGLEFGALRVINEDRVTPGEGFGKHSHREFEIFSYIVRFTGGQAL